jgi:hypothetical protein
MMDHIGGDDEVKSNPPLPASRLNETMPGVEPVEDRPSIVASENITSTGKRTIHVAGDGTPPKLHRMRKAAREAVEENLLPRVERLRQASTVVLDEAAYDPSLRFVLIAIVIFIIFLIILLASRILG